MICQSGLLLDGSMKLLNGWKSSTNKFRRCPIRKDHTGTRAVGTQLFIEGHDAQHMLQEETHADDEKLCLRKQGSLQESPTYVLC